MYVGIIETNQGSIILIYSKVTSVYPKGASALTLTLSEQFHAMIVNVTPSLQKNAISNLLNPLSLCFSF